MSAALRPLLRPALAGSAALAGAGLALSLAACWPVQIRCQVCGQDESFVDCEQLYCRALSASTLCGARDLERCFADHNCPTPPFLFCPADTSGD